MKAIQWLVEKPEVGAKQGEVAVFNDETQADAFIQAEMAKQVKLPKEVEPVEEGKKDFKSGKKAAPVEK